MFDLGTMELLLIAGTALIVVGPKDLPVMFKKVGNFVGKARRMAREFQNTMESAADDTGLKETTRMLNTIQSASSPTKFGKSVLKDALEIDENLDIKSERNAPNEIRSKDEPSKRKKSRVKSEDKQGVSKNR